ncbi:SGNH/GDSL hydrolase family protein [Candidatus Sumerlaeota bacterium]|nr:SGNH/GDSL hydrolase family protein [Candidatus Sumerlaeota bacterium]MBI3737379.1 SGNH/GDSL hydrolase family protein [Candidatus Sumerlaeota bacterium]
MNARVNLKSLPVGKKIAFSILLQVATLAVSEIAFRLLGIGNPETLHEDLRRTTWKLAWKGSNFYLSKDPGHNSDLLMDREHTVENPAGQRRVVFLGDSVTYGVDIPYEKSIPQLFEQGANARGNPTETFKMALPGWCTFQEEIAYKTIARKYKPDLVVLGFCLNDVAEMQNNLTEPKPMLKILGLAYRHSNVVRSIMRPREREIYRVEELFQHPERAKVKSGWKLTFDKLEELVREVRADGARFVLLIYPFRLQVEPDAPDPIPQEALAKWCIDHGVDYLDVLPVMKGIGPAGYIDYDHFSPAGTEAIVQTMMKSKMFDLSR